MIAADFCFALVLRRAGQSRRLCAVKPECEKKTFFICQTYGQNNSKLGLVQTDRVC